jgi:hypothetical protein
MKFPSRGCNCSAAAATTVNPLLHYIHNISAACECCTAAGTSCAAYGIYVYKCVDAASLDPITDCNTFVPPTEDNELPQSHCNSNSVQFLFKSQKFDTKIVSLTNYHGHMARGGHALPKVSFGPAMPYPSTPCGWDTRETALWSFQGWPAHRVGGLRPSSTPLDTPRRTHIHCHQ